MSRIDIDERVIDLITERVVDALRDELEAIALQLAGNGARSPLTVGQVAERFGVARSTVYAHWRDWGGYKLGGSDKAPIRFEEERLPVALSQNPRDGVQPAVSRANRRRRRRHLLKDNPKSEDSLELTR
jgi:hypothetical protein